MILIGQFRDIKDKLYTLTINNNNGIDETITIGDKGLQFAGSPVTIESNVDDSFTHIIKKNATINLVTDKYIGDKLFANNSRNISVRIDDDSKTVFQGYVEPTTFNQPFVHSIDEFSINCTDALSTLQYYNYKKTTVKNYNELKQTAGIVSFKQILDGIFQQLGGNIYYDLSKATKKGKEKTVFEDLSISEAYLFGDDFDDIWTEEEVLEQILQYLNLHIIQEGNNYYIFDWESIRKKNNQWYCINDGSIQTINPQTIDITSSMHSSDDTSITISDVYNQIQVKCDVEDFDDVIENPLDKGGLTSKYGSKQKYCTEYVGWGEGKSANDTINNMIQGRPYSSSNGTNYDWYLQVMDSSKWKMYGANKTLTSDLFKDKEQWEIAQYIKKNRLTPAILSFGNVQNNYNANDNSLVSKIDMDNYLYISINGNENDTEEGHQPSDSELQSHIGMMEYNGDNNSAIYSPIDDDTTNYLVFSGKILLQPVVYESSALYAVRSGTFQTCLTIGVGRARANTIQGESDNFYYTRKFYTPSNLKDKDDSKYIKEGTSLAPYTKERATPTFQYNFSQNGDWSDKYSKLPILECELIIGDKRCIETNIDKWGNSTFEWVKIGEEPVINDEKKTTFSLGVNPKIGDYIVGTEFPIQNTLSYEMNVDAEGTAIPIKRSDALSGKLTFRILGPVNLTWDEVTRRHPTFFRHTKWTTNTKFILSNVENIIIKNFEAKLKSNHSDVIGEKKDILYCSAETDKFISTKDDIIFKFITQLTTQEYIDKGIEPKVCLNSVVDTSNNMPILSIYNAITNETAKAEEHYVDAYYREYHQPKLILQMDAHNNINLCDIYNSKVLNKTFYIQSIDTDLKENKSHLVLKEI